MNCEKKTYLAVFF